MSRRTILFLILVFVSMIPCAAAGLSEAYEMTVSLNGHEETAVAHFIHYGDYAAKDYYPFASVNNDTTRGRIVISDLPDWPGTIPETGTLYINDVAYKVPVYRVTTVRKQFCILIVLPDDVDYRRSSVFVGPGQ